MVKNPDSFVRALADDFCRVRELHGASNEELIDAVFQAIPQFLPRVVDRRTVFAKKVKEFTDAIYKMREILSMSKFWGEKK